MGVDLTQAKVAVTGGAGFLGKWVIEALKRHGNADPFIVRSAEYDLREKAAIKQLYSDVKPDVVIHLAAVVGGIGANRDNPGRFFYENMVMGLELIEQARLVGLQKFVMIGTVCAYPKFTPVPFKEADLWKGYPEETNAPYGVAKKALLVQCQAYRQQYGFNGIYLLPVNLYGPYDNFDLHSSHVIPALIRKCVHARDNDLPTIEVWGDGSPSREFIHARDAAEGIVLATRDFDGAEPVNLGSGHEITIRDLVQTIKELVGYQGGVVWATDKPNGQPRRCLSTDRARELFAFEAKTALKQGLAETIEWWESVKS
jgi:GDP-L-fucose synthase